MSDFPVAIAPGDLGHIAHHELLATLFDELYTQGTLSQRPSPGVERRTFYATDTLEWFRDDGAAWHRVVMSDKAVITDPAVWVDVRSQSADTTGAVDSATQCQTAANTLTAGGTLYLGTGTFKWAGGITIAAAGVSVKGAGVGATRVNYTPTTGTAITFSSGTLSPGDRLSVGKVEGFWLWTTGAVSSVGVSLVRTFNADVTKLRVSNFFGCVRVTGDGSYLAFQTKMDMLLLEGYAGANSYGVSVDHAIETYLSNSYISAGDGSTTATGYGVWLDRGVDTFRGLNVNTECGLHGLFVAATDHGGAYGSQYPQNLWFQTTSFDSAIGGDCAYFDATLGTADIRAEFDLCWTAGSPFSGLGIHGGSDIGWRGGRHRYNGQNGVFISGAGTDIRLDQAMIVDNNYTNNADGHGVYVSNAAATVRIRDCRIGNVGYDVGGHQKYGVKVTAGNVIRRGGNWTLNDTGAYTGTVVGQFQIVGAAGQPAFTNSWSAVFAVANAVQVPAFWKDDDNVVHLAGVVGAGNSTTKMWDMPATYRPANEEWFTVMADGGIGRLTIAPGGAVTLGAGGGAPTTWCVLSGVSYKAAE